MAADVRDALQLRVVGIVDSHIALVGFHKADHNLRGAGAMGHHAHLGICRYTGREQVMANKHTPDLNGIDVEIHDNVITMTAENHELAVRFLSGMVALFAMVAGEDHVMVKEDAGKPLN